MMPISVVLISGLLFLFIVWAALRKRLPQLVAAEQAFKFHELRDELQILAIANKFDAQSHSYAALMNIMNLAIKNAGSINWQDLFCLTKSVEKEVSGISYASFQTDLGKQSTEAQELAANFFRYFSFVLLSNDTITYWLGKLFHVAKNRFNRQVLLWGKKAVRFLDPQRSKIIRYANHYQFIGEQLHFH